MFRLIFQMTAPAILALLTPNTTWANICDTVAHDAARQYNVPAKVLMALTRTETGRTVQGEFAPWPWTINDRGKGYWFTSQKEMLDFAKALRKQGVSSFDVGCFQLNYRWHSKGFASIDDMANPHTNAAYAAKFVRQLYDEFDNWTLAAGAYHSRTPKYADRYKTRFSKILSSLPAQVTTARSVAHNTFPLLVRDDAPSRGGSLFPQNAGRARPIIVGLE